MRVERCHLFGLEFEGRLEGVSMNTSTSISGVSKVIHSHDTRRRRNGVPIPYALARCNS